MSELSKTTDFETLAIKLMHLGVRGEKLQNKIAHLIIARLDREHNACIDAVLEKMHEEFVPINCEDCFSDEDTQYRIGRSGAIEQFKRIIESLRKEQEVDHE